MFYNKKIFITINLILLLSILLPLPARMLIVTKVAYGIDEKNSVDVTDKFFNRKSGNWMNETFGDPYVGDDKKLSIKYRKLNNTEWTKILNKLKTKPKTIIVQEKTDLNLDQQTYTESNIELPDSNTIYAIEEVIYGKRKGPTYIGNDIAYEGTNGTEKIANRKNKKSADWMKEIFGDPYKDSTKRLYIKYMILKEDDEATYRYEAFFKTTFQKELNEYQELNGL